jgi:DNA modification methylase
MRTTGELGVINLTDIEIGERYRKDYGDLQAFALDIKEKGLICPVAVSVQEKEGHPPYKLEAGGRRFAAHLFLGEKEIKCRIFPTPLTSYQSRAIELSENFHRKDLEPMEKALLIDEVDRLWKVEHGGLKSTTDPTLGHSMRDTAELMGVSPQTVSLSVRLAEAHRKMPGLELDKCKTQKEAFKKLDTFQKTIHREQVARIVEKDATGEKKRLIESYILGDFFEKAKIIPDRYFNMIEVDPPFGIDLHAIKKSTTSFESTYTDNYVEVEHIDYPQFLTNLFNECWRMASDNSWMVCWYAAEPWAEVVFEKAQDAGWVGRRLPIIWKKPAGQLQQPRYYLANVTEYAYYFRKGDPQIIKQGRDNVFDFKPANPQEKIHPTERPLELMKEVLSTFCEEGSRVLVPFAGSGVTLKAAFELHMIAIGFDKVQIFKDAFTASVTGVKNG